MQCRIVLVSYNSLWQENNLLKVRPEEKKLTSRCLCGALVQSCSCEISHGCLWVQKHTDTRFTPFILGSCEAGSKCPRNVPKLFNIKFSRVSENIPCH